MARKRSTAFLIVGLVVWVIVLAVGAAALLGRGSGPFTASTIWDEEVVTGDFGPKIAMIDIVGEIFSGHSEGGPFGGGGVFGADDYVGQLRQAEVDDSVEAVILNIDSPGGSVVASDQIYRQVRALSSVKPVVALLGDTAASGGYYVAAGASHVIAHPSTLTGSIGVIAMFPNLEGAADKLGVRAIVIKSGRLKDIGSPFRDMTSEERRILQRAIDESYDGFVDVVATERNLPEAQVRRLADGRIYTGRQALALELVDELGGYDEAVDAASGAASLNEEPTVVRYVSPGFGFGDVFAGRFDIGRAVRDAVDDVTHGATERPGLHYLWLR